MSKVWFTSDIHIGHRKVSAVRAGVESATPDEYAEIITAHNDLLARNWDSVVSPADVVWVLGDLAAGSGSAARNALEWVAQRPGRKRLIAGNHDPIHPMNRDAYRHAADYDEVFEWVAPFARIKHGGVEYLLSHFPYHGDHTSESRYDAYRLRDTGIPLMHGHTHSSERFSVSEAGTPQIHVGVDAWGMTPVASDDVFGVGTVEG